MTFPAVRDRPYHLFEPEHDELRDALRRLVDDRLVPRAGDLERERAFPRELLAELGELGYLGLAFPHDAGGADDVVADAVLSEELGRSGLYGVAGATIELRAAALALLLGGADAQRQRILPGLLAGRALWALGVGEPSLDPDPHEIRASARSGEGRFELSGEKAFVPLAGVADGYLVAARTAERVALFAVEAGSLEAAEEEVLGSWECPVGTVHLDGAVIDANARLPAGAPDILAAVGRWRALAEGFALVGLAARALDVALAYGLERQAFDRPVARFQVWRHRWAEAATDLESTRALCIHALRLYAAGEPAARAIAAARLRAGRVAYRMADEGVQMHGGYGYMMEFDAQRFWRDARQATVVGGGDHPYLETIARELGL